MKPALPHLSKRDTIRMGSDIVNMWKPYKWPVKLPRKLKKKLQDRVRLNSCTVVRRNPKGRIVRKPLRSMSRTWRRSEIVILAVGSRPGRPWGIRAVNMTPRQFHSMLRK